MVQAGFVTGSLFSAFLNLADRIAPPMIFLWAACLAEVSTILTAAAADTYSAALCIRFVTGFALSGVYGPGLKLISSWFRIRRGMALGIIVGSLTFGSASPHLFYGFGLPSWETVLWLAGTASICSGLLVFITLSTGPYFLPSGKFDPRAIPRAFRYMPVRLANFGYFGHSWELYGMWTWIGTFLFQSFNERSLPHSSLLSSSLTFAIIGSGFFGAWAGGVIADRFGREQVTIWSLAISGTISLLIGFFYGGPPWLLGLLGVIWGFSIIADSAQFSALVTKHADQKYVGSVLTFQLAAGFAITMIIILLVPLTAEVIGWQFVFLILLPGPVLGLLSMVKLKKEGS
ncbi:MFS transporter [Alteribacillus sp. HJP-4]|uniref:MFS transporter n=1 Tax=Alteribacillus sp. HJP-4 TaxID=2775394 RepID=UPI0035CD0EE5